MDTLRPILIAAAFTAILLGEPGTPMAADGDRPGERFVSVSATGSVDAEPDLASVSVGAIVEADTAKEAFARSSTLMTKLIDGLKALGIAAKDIETTAINIERATPRPKTAIPLLLPAIGSSTGCILGCVR
jgi:uncharacterized protein YggE